MTTYVCMYVYSTDEVHKGQPSWSVAPAIAKPFLSCAAIDNTGGIVDTAVSSRATSKSKIKYNVVLKFRTKPVLAFLHFIHNLQQKYESETSTPVNMIS